MSNADIIAKAVRIRKLLSLDPAKPINIFAELEKRDGEYTIVQLPLSENVRGFSCRRGEHKIIIINANDTEPQKNYSCAHELYHLYFDFADEGRKGGESLNEKDAENFAAHFLISQDALFDYLQEHRVNPRQCTSTQLCEMERYFRVSRQALAIRLQREGLINREQYERYTSNVKKNARRSGFDEGYYEKNNDSYSTIGEYVRLADELYQSGKISKSKRDGYLLDAFCEEIVYNLPRSK